jgi:hypothetical protein
MPPTSHVPGVGRGASNTSTGLMSENLESQPQLRQPLLEWCAWWHVYGRLSRTCNHHARHCGSEETCECKHSSHIAGLLQSRTPAQRTGRLTRSAVTMHVNGQMSAVVAAKTLGGQSITSMTPANPPPVKRLHAWSSRVQTPSLHGHVRLPVRVRKKSSRASRHRRTASCADTHVGQLQKFALALCMHLRTQHKQQRWNRTHTRHTHARKEL